MRAHADSPLSALLVTPARSSRMYERPGGTAYVGCVGEDEFGNQLEVAAKGDGVNVQYMKQKEEPTGTCAVLVKDNERSLIANLAAANKYDKARRAAPRR